MSRDSHLLAAGEEVWCDAVASSPSASSSPVSWVGESGLRLRSSSSPRLSSCVRSVIDLISSISSLAACDIATASERILCCWYSCWNALRRWCWNDGVGISSGNAVLWTSGYCRYDVNASAAVSVGRRVTWSSNGRWRLIFTGGRNIGVAAGP